MNINEVNILALAYLGDSVYELRVRDYLIKNKTYKVNNLQETENIIEKQRAIKDEEEIRKITKACNLTDKCFDYLKTFIKKGMTEKEIADEIERYFKKNGADGLSFETIVASRTKFI